MSVLKLSLLLLVSAWVATAQADKNEVLVLGMIHGGHRTSERYGIDEIQNIVRAVRPDYILTEIPPDRFDTAMQEFRETGTIDEPRVRRFPEYIEAIFPLTREMDFRIIPTAGWTKPMADRRREQLGEISRNRERRRDWQAYTRGFARSDSAIAVGGADDDPYWIHTDAYDDATELGLGAYNRLFNDELGDGGWDNINAAHYGHIARALDELGGAGKRVLITYGSGHKGWFLRELRKRDDIVLLDAEPFLDAAGISRTAVDFKPPKYIAPPFTWVENNLAGFAKVICSAVFVSGRKLEEVVENSGNLFLDPRLKQTPRDMLKHLSVDRERKEVRTTIDGVTKVARYVGDQGCVCLPDDADIQFKPHVVKSSLPDAETRDWPMGDREPQDALPRYDNAKIEHALDLAFAKPEFRTAGVVVVYKGRIVGERYGASAHKEMQLESWSMGKSIAALLIGVLAQQERVDLNAPAPIKEWQSTGDTRGMITINDLLRMSSGLRFSGHRDPDYSPDTDYPDHFWIYTGAVDAYQWSVDKPLAAAANSIGRYHNCDPLILMGIIKQVTGNDYLTFPQKELFDRVGIRKQVLETDPYGNFLITGYDYGTPRNWARLGLLCLQDGMWQGERLLPEGFVDFMRAPAPAWDEPEYGGLVWLNLTGKQNLPEDAYYFAGAGGQYTFIVPSLDLVFVRMGHSAGYTPDMLEHLKRAQGEIVAAINLAPRDR